LLQIDQLNVDKEGLEKERDFYFNKLREIEVICQDNEAASHVKEIMDVLYATEGDHDSDSSNNGPLMP
jgi:RP/EB family microtubule-associated protein